MGNIIQKYIYGISKKDIETLGTKPKWKLQNHCNIHGEVYYVCPICVPPKKITTKYSFHPTNIQNSINMANFVLLWFCSYLVMKICQLSVLQNSNLPFRIDHNQYKSATKNFRIHNIEHKIADTSVINNRHPFKSHLWSLEFRNSNLQL